VAMIFHSVAMIFSIAGIWAVFGNPKINAFEKTLWSFGCLAFAVAEIVEIFSPKEPQDGHFFKHPKLQYVLTFAITSSVVALVVFGDLPEVSALERLIFGAGALAILAYDLRLLFGPQKKTQSRSGKCHACGEECATATRCVHHPDFPLCTTKDGSVNPDCFDKHLDRYHYTSAAKISHNDV
jgi:hypothetical protein